VEQPNVASVAGGCLDRNAVLLDLSLELLAVDTEKGRCADILPPDSFRAEMIVSFSTAFRASFKFRGRDGRSAGLRLGVMEYGGRSAGRTSEVLAKEMARSMMFSSSGRCRDRRARAGGSVPRR